ncbi:MAG: glutathione S-transferase family protein [Pseudomonadota bacterium]
MYELHGSPRSRAFRAIWMLEELGVDYTHHNTPPRSPEIYALNPLGKVPVLKVGETVITDSTAILTYLADKHGALTFPAGTTERALQDGHTQFILDEIDALLWLVARHSFGLPEDLRVPAIKESARAEFKISADRLSARIAASGGPFLMGARMTIADIIAVHCLGWALVAKFPMERDDLKAYSKTMRERAAYKRAQSA